MENNKFKVGDRVRLINDRTTNARAGAEAVVGPKGCYEQYVDVVWDIPSLNGRGQMNGGYYTHLFELLPATPTIAPELGRRFKTRSGSTTSVMYRDNGNFEAIVDGKARAYDEAGGHVFGDTGLDLVEILPLQIEAGKYYRTRDGRKVGPISMMDFGDGYPFEVEAGWWVSPSGTAQAGSHGGDLIAEWIDEPVAVAASNDNAHAAEKPKFNVGDKVRATRDCDNVRAGRTYTIAKYARPTAIGAWVMLDGIRGFTDDGSFLESNFELVQSASPRSTTTAIVCLMEHGQPKPAVRPFVHTSVEAAEKEAERLAGIHKGKEFAVLTIGASCKQEPVYSHEWQRLAAEGKDGRASASLAEKAGLSRDIAHDTVMAWIRDNRLPHPWAASAA